MARAVVSVIRSAPRPPRANHPVLEANAYAVAENLDLTLLLRDGGVDLAIAAPDPAPVELAGVELPEPQAGADLQGLIESGVPVFADGPSLDRLGIRPDELAAGIRVLDRADVVDLLRRADAVITW